MKMASCLQGMKHIEMLQWFVALQMAVLISVLLKFHRIGGSNLKNVPRKVEGLWRGVGGKHGTFLKER